MKRRMIAAIIVFLLSIPLCIFAGANMHCLLSGQPLALNIADLAAALTIRQTQLFSLIFLGVAVLLIATAMVSSSSVKINNSVQQIVPGLNTPVAAGHGEFGTARFISSREASKCWKVIPLKKLLKKMR